MIQYIPTILAAAAIVSRYVRIAQPVLGWLPARWQWLPGAALAVAGELAQGLPVATTDADVGAVALRCLVVGALAAAAGLHAPTPPTPPAPPADGDKVSRITIAGAGMLALLVVSCSRHQTKTAHDVACSDISIATIDEVCGALVESVQRQDRDAVEAACRLVFETQERVCR